MHIARWNFWNGCRRAHRKGLFRQSFLCPHFCPPFSEIHRNK
uniref:Uncharacterized protein n=1 Tax=Siphoviridae sp. ctzXg6 TaxID=2826531 RepID=A0A8S5NCK3_9CAUD|nr:MAG TPA: hypothetical protein [Siphoviridae sp. ctzXg6]DAI16108.1 MAG TPA: hypothetical protein [Caudoviricetes sp.]